MDEHDTRMLAAVVAHLVATLRWTADRAEAFAYEATRAYGGHPVPDAVATLLHDERIDATWPACPLHPNHPLPTDRGDEETTCSVNVPVRNPGHRTSVAA